MKHLLVDWFPPCVRPLTGAVLPAVRRRRLVDAQRVMRADTRSQLDEAAPVGSSVLEWRREQLVAASFPSGLAEEIASDRRYDLHALIELVERGCPAALAARILAPDIR